MIAHGYLGVGGGEEVGTMSGSGTAGQSHAALWTGTAGSAVDLNPTGITQSAATATDGTLQVGFISGTATSNQMHATVWSGTAGSAVDLQLMLPTSGSWLESQAMSIDGTGDVFGYAYGTYGTTTGTFAVEWLAADIAAPEPGSAAMLAAGCVGLLGRRRRSRSPA